MTIKAYLNMLNKRGPVFLIKYFINAHLFDLLNHTDTHLWVQKDPSSTNSPNLKFGILYMPTWTNIISKSFKIVNNRYDLNNMTFVDVGSGKGKVLIHWNKLLRKQKVSMGLIGIEYSTQLVAISKINLKNTNLENNIKIFNSDILEFDFRNYGSSFIFFMYNPFNDLMLNRFLNKISDIKCIIIYVNSQQNNLNDLHKLKLIYSNNKKLPHESLLIYENTPH